MICSVELEGEEGAAWMRVRGERRRREKRAMKWEAVGIILWEVGLGRNSEVWKTGRI